jgi:hypothetical protein
MKKNKNSKLFNGNTSKQVLREEDLRNKLFIESLKGFHEIH